MRGSARSSMGVRWGVGVEVKGGGWRTGREARIALEGKGGGGREGREGKRWGYQDKGRGEGARGEGREEMGRPGWLGGKLGRGRGGVGEGGYGGRVRLKSFR